MFKKIVLFISILITVKTVNAQSDSLKIGGWRSYLPYQLSRSVTQSKDEIIIATEFSIMSIDKAENSFSFKSKVEGLSDAGVQLVKYNKFSDILFIAYTNSNIDLVYKDGEIVNIRDIVDNINIVGDKTIYDVYIKDATFAYIACGFGVLKMNMKKGEFDFTTFTNSKVRGVAVWNNNLYIATEKGVFSIEDNNSLNPADFNLWKILGKKAIADSAYNARVVASYQDKLYFDANDTLFSYDGNSFRKIFYNKNDYISCLTTEGKKMLIGVWRTQSDGGTWGGRLFYLNENLTLGEVPNSNDCIVDLNYAIEDENGQIWLADVERGVKVFSSINGGCRYISTNSPFSHTMQQLKLEDNNIWIASGGFTTNNSYNGNPDGFYHYIDGKWGFKNRSNDPIMKDGYLYNIHTVTSVAVNKDTKRRFIGSFWGGLLELDEKGNIIKHYTAKNSSLQTAIGDANSTRVGGIAFDKNGTLWVSNNSATRPLSALTSDGKWHSMASDFANAQVYQIAVDPNTGYKWMAIGKGNASIFVYDEGKNIDDESDDRSIVLNSTNTLLPGSKVNWMESDLDGKMWVATDDGVIWFSCGSSIFDKATKSGICNGSLPTTIVDGIPEYLLKYNNVNTVAVDGANRKWFGTSNGIFVQSADGKSQIAYFDKTNSPLFDNNIIDIEINDNTGEIFIATNKGLQSIKGEALLGSDIHYDVTVYPNPVRPEYEGLIAIKGLAEDANVKITDINGALVYETTALGGQAVWDGRDYKGRTVQKGVYLIFSAFTKDVEYPDEAVAKVLIMK